MRHAVGPVPGPLPPEPSTLPVARRAQGRQGWTAPALISRLPSLLQLPGCPRELQTLPTSVSAEPSDVSISVSKLGKGGEEGRGEGGWGGRRYADSESEFPLESLKSVHVLKKNGTNLRSQPRGHVPPPAALPPRRPRSLLPAVAARAPSPSPPIGGSAFGGTLGPEKLGPYK